MTAGIRPTLLVENLTVRFGAPDDAVGAVDGISLAIAPGECLALVGESGSGKSVTARSIVGLAGPRSRVTADRLEVAGVDVRTLGRRSLERLRGATVGMISQDALVALDPLRRVGREVDDALRLHTRLTVAERRLRVLELIAEAGIPDAVLRAGQFSGQLSGGLRQRALIAAAIAADPPLLIADEPTTALDSQVRDGILDLIARQATRGAAVLLISHDLAAVRRIATRVAVMREGRIVEIGNTDEVLQRPAHPYTRRLLAASPAGKPRHSLLVTERGAVSPAAAALPASDSAPAVALEATDVSVAFALPGGARQQVLDSVSFQLRQGMTLGLVGPSGSGKTTLARVALGLERTDSGEVLLSGAPWSALTERQRRPLRGTIGGIYQDPLGSFDPRLTVGMVLADAVTRGRDIRASTTAARVRELLDSVGLAKGFAERRPLSLSGGQRQRVAIARALAAEPRVLVLDEPVSSLDVTIQAQILDLLNLLQRERSLSYLFISHDIEVIDHMSDGVLRLDNRPG